MIPWRRSDARSSYSMTIIRERYPYAISGVSPKRSGIDWRTTSCTCIYLFFVQWLMMLPVRQAMIDEFDLDQDGEINEQEFFAIMTDDA